MIAPTVYTISVYSAVHFIPWTTAEAMTTTTDEYIVSETLNRAAREVHDRGGRKFRIGGRFLAKNPCSGRWSRRGEVWSKEKKKKKENIVLVGDLSTANCVKTPCFRSSTGRITITGARDVSREQYTIYIHYIIIGTCNRL